MPFSENEMLPACLRWPDDPICRLSMAKSLPEQLFSQLRSCLSLPIPPLPELIKAAWDQRPPSLQDAIEPARWIDAYAQAWQVRQGLASSDELPSTNSSKESWPEQSYVTACRALLLGKNARTVVPIVTVNGSKQGRVQHLHLHTVAAGHAGLHVHPESAWQLPRSDAAFQAGMENAWKLASIGGADSVQVFWRISEANGTQPENADLRGSSASGAAFRALWHVLHGLYLDEHVYVLTSIGENTGDIRDVADIGPKIEAIHSCQQHRDSIPAIVIAAESSGRTQHDTTAIAQSESWAVVNRVSACAGLTAVRSCESTAAIAYLRHFADSLDQCRLLPRGKRLSELHVPPQVWKDERIRPEHEAGWRDEPETDGPNSAEDRDSPQKKRRVRQPWERVFQMHRGRSPLVLVGGPGSGKSTVLHWTALEMAREAIAALESRASGPVGVSWPVLLNLDTWAAHEPKQQPRASLISLITRTVPEDMPSHDREAVTRVIAHRLSTAIDRTYLFFDALDQVDALARGPTLAKRLAALSDLTHRLVLTTRESALRTHDETIKTLPSPTIVQSAPLTPEDARTLAAKWLGPEQAARLESHLRSHPSLGIVADSPLLLTLACLVASEKPGLTMPETPAALYQEMMLLLAQGRWRNGDDAPPASHDPQALLDQLPAIAWRLFVCSPGVNRFDRDTMLEAIRQSTALKGKAATDFLDLQLVELGFVEASQESKTEPQYEFRHTTLLEFLAARHLATSVHLHTWAAAAVDTWQDGTGWHTAKVGDLLDAQAFEPSWEPVILFVAGLLKEPLPLIEMLKNEKMDDVKCNRLHLAWKCLCGIKPETGSALEEETNSSLDKLIESENALNESNKLMPKKIELFYMLFANGYAPQKLKPFLLSLLNALDTNPDLENTPLTYINGGEAILNLIELALNSNYSTSIRNDLKIFSEADHKVSIQLIESLIQNALLLNDKQELDYWLDIMLKNAHPKVDGSVIAKKLIESQDDKLRYKVVYEFYKERALNKKIGVFWRLLAFKEYLQHTTLSLNDTICSTLCEFVQGPLKLWLNEGNNEGNVNDWLLYSIADEDALQHAITILKSGINQDDYHKLVENYAFILHDNRYDLNARITLGLSLAECGFHQARDLVDQIMCDVFNDEITDSGRLWWLAIRRLVELRSKFDEKIWSLAYKLLHEPLVIPGFKASIGWLAKVHGHSELAELAAREIYKAVNILRDNGYLIFGPTSFEYEFAKLIRETSLWEGCVESAIERATSGKFIDWFDSVVLVNGGNSKILLRILKTFNSNNSNHMQVKDLIVNELYNRGWLLKFKAFKIWFVGRESIVVLKEGRESTRTHF